MLPEQKTINDLNIKNASYTYNINRNTNRISGFIDNKEAIIQAIYLILSTERYESLIYNWFYGVELDELIGKNEDYVISEIKRTIKESLLEDDRILDVNKFNFEFLEDNLIIYFTVLTKEGDIDLSWRLKK